MKPGQFVFSPTHGHRPLIFLKINQVESADFLPPDRPLSMDSDFLTFTCPLHNQTQMQWQYKVDGGAYRCLVDNIILF